MAETGRLIDRPAWPWTVATPHDARANGWPGLALTRFDRRDTAIDLSLEPSRHAPKERAVFVADMLTRPRH